MLQRQSPANSDDSTGFLQNAGFIEDSLKYTPPRQEDVLTGQFLRKPVRTADGHKSACNHRLTNTIRIFSPETKAETLPQTLLPNRPQMQKKDETSCGTQADSQRLGNQPSSSGDMASADPKVYNSQFPLIPAPSARRMRQVYAPHRLSTRLLPPRRYFAAEFGQAR